MRRIKNIGANRRPHCPPHPKRFDFKRYLPDLVRQQAASILPPGLLPLLQEQEVVDLFEQAMRLSPKHPWYLSFGYGLALHLVGRMEEAVATYKKAIGLSPKSARIHARLAAVSVDLGRMDEARAAADEVMRPNPKLTASRYMKSYSLHDPARDAWYKDLLLRAGLPE